MSAAVCTAICRSFRTPCSAPLFEPGKPSSVVMPGRKTPVHVNATIAMNDGAVGKAVIPMTVRGTTTTRAPAASAARQCKPRSATAVRSSPDQNVAESVDNVSRADSGGSAISNDRGETNLSRGFKG